MSVPTQETLLQALAGVEDPEIHRPITELGMVDGLSIDDAGRVSVTILLTVAACPLKDTLTRDSTAALMKVPGVTAVDVTLGVMTYLEVTAEARYDGIYANEPIYYGLAVSALVYVVVSLATRPTDSRVMAAWDRRVAGEVPDDVPVDAAR